MTHSGRKMYGEAGPGSDSKSAPSFGPSSQGRGAEPPVPLAAEGGGEGDQAKVAPHHEISKWENTCDDENAQDGYKCDSKRSAGAPRAVGDSRRSSNVSWYERRLTRDDYRTRNGHDSALLWFTGLSGSGKSTLAHLVEERLFAKGWHTFVLDGDNVRHGINGDLGFSEADRHENVRRVGEVAKLFTEAGVVVLAALISPYRQDRDRVRRLFGPRQFIEIFLKCDLHICESRDPKGLYRKARAGKLPDFTGIDSPYEEPLHPELLIDTGSTSIEQSAQAILDYLAGRLHSGPGRSIR